MLPIVSKLVAAAALATGAAITLINNQINTVNYTGAAVGGVTLPAATAGDVVIYVQSIDTTSGGVAALTFNAAGTDVWATGSVIESRAGAAVTHDVSTAGDVCVYVQSVDTTGGTNALTINAAGTDVWATGSVIESRAANAVTHDISTAGETALVFTPAAVTTNLLTTGGTIAFICYTTGTWNIAYKLGGAGTAVTGAFAFGA